MATLGDSQGDDSGHTVASELQSANPKMCQRRAARSCLGENLPWSEQRTLTRGAL